MTYRELLEDALNQEEIKALELDKVEDWLLFQILDILADNTSWIGDYLEMYNFEGVNIDTIDELSLSDLSTWVKLIKNLKAQDVTKTYNLEEVQMSNFEGEGGVLIFIILSPAKLGGLETEQAYGYDFYSQIHRKKHLKYNMDEIAIISVFTI